MFNNTQGKKNPHHFTIFDIYGKDAGNLFSVGDRKKPPSCQINVFFVAQCDLQAAYLNLWFIWIEVAVKEMTLETKV